MFTVTWTPKSEQNQRRMKLPKEPHYIKFRYRLYSWLNALFLPQIWSITKVHLTKRVIKCFNWKIVCSTSECAISRDVPITANAASSEQKSNQTRRPGTNRPKTAPAKRHANWRHRQRHPHQQLHPPPWNKSSPHRRQSRESTNNNKIIAVQQHTWILKINLSLFKKSWRRYSISGFKFLIC